MEDRQQWLSIAAVVLVIGGLGFFLYKRSRQAPSEPTAVGEGITIEEKANELLERMNVKVPENADKITLNDVSNKGGTGVATRSFENNRFSHSVMAALPDLETGTYYEAWLVRENPADTVSTGKLRQAKGGWILEYSTGKNLTDHAKVMVTLEKVNDQKPETTILEGQFK